MTDQWILKDIDQLMQHRNRVVLLDPSGQCNFVLQALAQKNYAILQTDITFTEHWQQLQEELLLRHEAETKYSNSPVVFYVTRPLDKLSFLFDYCFTHACLDLSYPQEWLKTKIFHATGLQVNLNNPLLLTAAKLGRDKDLDWWKKIVQNLEEVIDLGEELLPFLHDPAEYLQKLDVDIKRLFEEKLFELIEQPYSAKSPAILASEVVKKMLDGLMNKEIPERLLLLYYKWIDSNLYRPSLDSYLLKYKYPATPNPWNVHPDHCFTKIDQLALQAITENFRDRSFVDERLQKVKKRIFSVKAKPFIPSWWIDLWTLFYTDTKELSICKNLNDFVRYYTHTFSKTDRAIRNLYQSFLNDERLIRPLQEYYESMNHILLETWFGYTSEYSSDQQGFLPKLFDSAKPKIAVIVGDGIRYEIASHIADELSQFNVERKVMLADMPSETEHNMSALYVGNNELIASHKERGVKLKQLTNKPIEFYSLEQLNHSVEADFLVLSYKDIDDTGEKLQHAAIKLFSEFETVIAEKIALLLNMGYSEVHLVTDHGFVLTGLLDEADKIEPSVSGKKEVHERYIRTVEKQYGEEWLEFERSFAECNYVYVSRNHRPFRSKGMYGYSHGGFTPQEIILPNFKFSKKKPETSSLEVFISNKQDLAEITGNHFAIRLDASTSATDLFASQRKVQLKLHAGGKEYQSSTIINMETGKTESVECSFGNNDQVQAVLLDAVTQEQLDKVDVKKSGLRDMGGLI